MIKISPVAVRALVLLAIAAQSVAFVLSWTSWLPAGFFMQLWPAGMDPGAALALSPALRASGAVIALPSLAALCYGLWQLAQLAANTCRGVTFDLDNILRLRRFAGAILLSTTLSILEVPLRVLAWRMAFNQQLPLSIGVNGDQIMVILMCGLFYLVVRLMHEGRRLARENEGFV